VALWERGAAEPPPAPPAADRCLCHGSLVVKVPYPKSSAVRMSAEGAGGQAPRASAREAESVKSGLGRIVWNVARLRPNQDSGPIGASSSLWASTEVCARRSRNTISVAGRHRLSAWPHGPTHRVAGNAERSPAPRVFDSQVSAIGFRATS